METKGKQGRARELWHRADEQPESGRYVLTVTERGIPFIAGPNNEDWEECARQLGVTEWAYTDDLRAPSFGDILEADKDVLERIKEKGD